MIAFSPAGGGEKAVKSMLPEKNNYLSAYLKEVLLMIKKNVTMSDIAKAMNISTVSVSKALGDREGVSESLRERIKQKAAEMGYRFRKGEHVSPEELKRNIGIVMAKSVIGDPASLCWELYKHIVELLRKQDFYGMLEEFDDSEGAAEVPASVREDKVDGLIMIGRFPDEYIERLTSYYIPLVFVDFCISRTGADMVISDSFFGAYTLTSHLVANGHRRIGFVGNINGIPSVRDRYLGFYKALLENRLPLRQEWIISDRVGTIELPSPLPTAFVCGSDETAYRLVNRLADSGIRIPDDVSVVGYENHTYSTMCRPHLTTIDINHHALANEAVDIILHKIRDRDFTRGITLITGKLVSRDSVKNLFA